MFRLASVAALVLALGAAHGDVEIPRGKRAPRPAATHVIVRVADLDAQGAPVRLAPGVRVIVAGGRTDGPVGSRANVTVVGPAELAGRIEGSAIGVRLARRTALTDPASGTIVGEGLEGAFVTVVGRGANGVVCDTVGAVRARVAVPADALSGEPHELVYPVVAEKVAALSADGELLVSPGGRGRARLLRGARVALVGDDSGPLRRVRTYGAVVLEGFVAKERLGALAGAPPLDEAPPKGLTPTHEVLVQASASADAAGKRPIGTLHGGALVAVGIEVAGPRVRVMTYGDAVGEMWVPSAALRPLEREIWNERD